MADHMRQRRDIAQPGVQPLPGNRVHPMRGITDQCDTVRDEPVGQSQPQRIGEPLSGQGNLSQKIAETRAQHGQVVLFRQGVDLFGQPFALTPDNGRPIARQRQDRQRPGRQEELMRHAAMGLFMCNRADQCGLIVVPRCAPDAGTLPGSGLTAIGSHDHLPGQHVARRQSDIGPRRGHVLIHNGFARQMRDQRLGRHRLKQRPPQIPVFEHVAHRAFLDLGAVEVQAKKHLGIARAPVADLDLGHRLRVRFQPVPQPQRGQHPHRGQRQRIGPPVEIVAAPRAFGACVDDGAGQAHLGGGKGQRRAVQPAADDQDI